jgi:hypothetical protein
MAYFVLTLTQSMAGGRPGAAKIFCVSRTVLDHIGRLSSTKGDEITARKMDPTKGLSQLTGLEAAWLKQAIRRLVLRLGEHAAGGPLATLDMSDLPTM